MAEPFLGEIRMFAGNFAPTGWAFCDGQLLPIAQNTALFSLLGTNFGGDGRQTFALPNLQGSAPLGFGQGSGLSNYDEGSSGGTADVTLTTTELPMHNHTLSVTNTLADTRNPANRVPAVSDHYVYSTCPPATTLAANAVGTIGSGEPHNNWQPYLTVSFIIALSGIFPPRS